MVNQAPHVPKELSIQNQHTFNSQRGSGSYRSQGNLSYRQDQQLSPQPQLDCPNVNSMVMFDQLSQSGFSQNQFSD